MHDGQLWMTNLLYRPQHQFTNNPLQSKEKGEEKYILKLSFEIYDTHFERASNLGNMYLKYNEK